MTRFSFILASAFAILFISDSATAAILDLQLGANSFNGQSGDTVTLDLWFVDPDGVLAPEGLQSGGGRIVLDSASTGSAAVGPGGVAPNALFDFLSLIYPVDEPFPAGDPTGYENISGFYAFSFDAVALGQSGILLGTFTVTITGNPGDFVTIAPWTLTNDPGDNPAIVGYNLPGTNFDVLVEEQGQHGLTFMIASPEVEDGVVPEPSTLLMMSIGLPAFAFLSHRLRRKSRSGMQNRSAKLQVRA
jgi:hypothetical protein